MVPPLPMDRLVQLQHALAGSGHRPSGQRVAATDQALARARSDMAETLPQEMPGRSALDEQLPPAAQPGEPISPDLHNQVLELAKSDPAMLDYFVRQGIEHELRAVPGLRSGIDPAGAPKPRMGLDPEAEFSDTVASHIDPNDYEALQGGSSERDQGFNVRGNASQVLGAERKDNATMGRFSGRISRADMEAMGLPGEAADYMTDEELQQLPKILAKLNARDGAPATEEVTFSDPEAARMAKARGDMLHPQKGSMARERTRVEAEQLLNDKQLDLRGSAKRERASNLAMRSSYDRGQRERLAQERGADSLNDMRVRDERTGRPTNDLVTLPKQAGRKYAPAREAIEQGSFKRSTVVDPKHLHKGMPPTSFEISALQKEGLKSTAAIDRARAAKGQPDLTEINASSKASSFANERRKGYHQFHNSDTTLDREAPSVSPVRITSKLIDEDRPPQIKNMRRDADARPNPTHREAIATRSDSVHETKNEGGGHNLAGHRTDYMGRTDPRGLQNTGDSALQDYRRTTGRKLQDYMAANDIEHGESVLAKQPPHIPQEYYTLGELEALYAPSRSYRGGRNSGGGLSNRPMQLGPEEHPGLHRERVNREHRQQLKGKFQQYAEKKFGKG